MPAHVATKRSLAQRLLITLVSAGVLAFATPIAQANSTFEIIFDVEYSSLSDSNAGCALCHDSPVPSGPSAKSFLINQYGADMQAAFDGSDIAGAMHAVDGVDSDGEGNSNLVEILAHAQPGWTDPAPVFLGDILLDPTTTTDNPPVADAGADVTGTVDVAVSFDGTGSTDDGTIVSYEWDFGDGTPTGTGATTSHTYTAAGIYTVTLTVTDDASPSQTDTDTAIADIADVVVNIAPVADPGGPYSGTVDIAVDFDGTASSDSDGTIASYVWDFGDGSPTGTGPTPSHVYTTASSYTVGLTVTDNDGATGFADTTASIGAADLLPPVANAGGPYTGVEGEPVTFDAGGSTDPDGNIVSYTWDFGDSTAPVTVASALVDHTYAVNGTYQAMLTVTDNDDLTGDDTADVTIVIGDTPPVADAGGPYTGTVGVPLQLDGTNSSDSGVIVTYDWDYGDGTSELDAGATPTHTYTAEGPYTISLTVTDDAGNIDSDTADATITTELQAPVAVPGGPYLGTVGVDVTFDGSGSTDADGTVVEWNWDFGDNTTGTGETTTHAYATVGDYTVTLTVTDDDNLTSDPATTTATISEGEQIPVADPNGPYTGVEGQEVTFDGTASFDPDGGNIVSYAWDFGDGNTGIGSNPTNVYAVAGTYTVTLTVTDDESQVSDPATTEAVIGMDEAPTALPGGPYSAQVDEPITFDGSGSFDPDGVIVAWDWDFGDGNTGSGETTTHVYTAVGTYDVSLTVTDDSGNIGTGATTATITAIPVEDLPPVADANGPYTALKDEVITFDGTGSTDPNGDDTIVSYNWDFGDGTTGTGATVEYAYSAAGTYSVTLEVTDDTGLTDSDGTSATILEEPIGDADVFLLKLNAAKKIVMVDGDEVDRVIRVFGDGTAVQDATVTLSVDVPDGVEVEFEPESITMTVAPGRPATQFFFNASVECEAKAVYEVVWTATIDAAENADLSNDTMTAVTEVRCIRGKREE